MGGLEIKEESSTRACPWQEERLPVATPEKWQHPKCKESKHISFTSLSIHEYSQVLGNHPCCMLGSPLCLGWDYTEGTQVSLEEFEKSRPRRRTLEAMRLSWDQRREILSNYSDGDVRRVQRKLSRQRFVREKVLQTFFADEPTTVLTV